MPLFLQQSTMNSDWIGKKISLDCGALGHYQGEIKKIDVKEKTVTIDKAFKNGKPSLIPEIILNSCDIQDISFIQENLARSPNQKSVVGLVGTRKKKSKKFEAEVVRDPAKASIKTSPDKIKGSIFTSTLAFMALVV